jgi:hypothetical protein
MLLRLKQQAGDGMRAAVWDGALHGVHIDPLMRAGLLVVSPMTAAENPTGAKKGKEGEQRQPLPPRPPAGTGRRSRLTGRGGALPEGRSRAG